MSISPPRFQVSVILPVTNEKESLLGTIEILENEVEVSEYLLVIGDKTSASSARLCQDICSRDPSRFRLFRQSLPFLGGAIREGFMQARGSHVIMMASDLETDPHSVPRMVELSKDNPEAIITASRWRAGCDFEGYDRLKLAANYLFQKVFSSIYRVELTDLTYGFRIFPTELVQGIKWQELKHAFLFETLLKPLRLGVPVFEMASHWRMRKEGISNNSFWNNFDYCRVGMINRFLPKNKICEKGYCYHHNQCAD